MKVLYCNPIFLDYRIPFYKKLNELFNKNFFVLYGTNKYKGRFESTLKRIQTEMSEMTFSFNGDHIYSTYYHKFDVITPKGYRIPITIGLLRNIRKIKPEVLITEGFFQWTPLVILYSIIFRVPVFMGYERTLYTERNKSKFTIWTRTFTNLFIAGYLVNGTETKKYLQSLGIKENKIHIGGMSADSRGLQDAIASFPNEEKEKFRKRICQDKGLTYLVVGRVEEPKGSPYLLEAWMKHIKKYPNDRIVFIGNGDLLEEMREKYKAESSILLEGRVEYTNVYKYYAIADVFILPTVNDNWSLVIPEAMSCGLPVATSIYNGCYTDLIKEGVNGFVFDTYNQESLIKTLDSFHYADLKKMGDASIEIEKKFDTEHSATRVYNAITNYIKKR